MGLQQAYGEDAEVCSPNLLLVLHACLDQLNVAGDARNLGGGGLY